MTRVDDLAVKAVPVEWWKPAGAEVERAARERGVAMAEPLVLDHRTEHHVVSVHRWLDGETVTQHDVADWAGRTLAVLHTIPAPASSPDDQWSDTYGAGVEWDHPLLQTITSLVRDAADDLPARVGSHRDIHGLNVIVTPAGGPHLLDWELAGPTRPWFEITRVAIDLGRNAAGTGTKRALAPDTSTVTRVVHAYLDAGDAPGPTDERALAGTFGILLARLRWRADDEDFLTENTAKLERRWADRDAVLAAIRRAVD